MSNTTPVQIKDKNGKFTTVHKRADAVTPSGSRLIPNLAPKTPTDVFQGFSMLNSGSSASLKFSDNDNVYTLSRTDEDKSLYLMIEPSEGETVYMWTRDATSFIFDDAHAEDTFNTLDDAVRNDLFTVAKDFYVRNHTDKAYMRIPEEIPAEQARSSKDYIGNRLESNDGLFARADYAEFSEHGVTYGVHVEYSALGEVFAGAQLDGESDEDFEARQVQAAIDNWGEVSSVIQEAYGADLEDGNNNDRGAVEFYVEYEDGGAAASSVEYMGDRVENETSILEYLNETSYAGEFSQRVANKFGYSTNANGDWVKD